MVQKHVLSILNVSFMGVIMINLKKMGILGVGLVIVLYIINSLQGSSTQEFEVTLKNSNVAEVLIITSTLYNANDWKNIRTLVTNETSKSSEIGTLHSSLRKLLTDNGYAIVSLSINRKRTVVLIRKRL